MPIKYIFTKKNIIIITIILIIALIVFGVLSIFTKESHREEVLVTDEGVIMTPATNEENDEVERMKDLIVEADSSSGESTDTSLVEVYPSITSWSTSLSDPNFWINGYVDGVVEDGGSCILAMTKDGETVSEEKKGRINVSSTTCGRIEVPVGKLTEGRWELSLEYKSDSAYGKSETVRVDL